LIKEDSRDLSAYPEDRREFDSVRFRWTVRCRLKTPSSRSAQGPLWRINLERLLQIRFRTQSVGSGCRKSTHRPMRHAKSTARTNLRRWWSKDARVTSSSLDTRSIAIDRSTCADVRIKIRCPTASLPPVSSVPAPRSAHTARLSRGPLQDSSHRLPPRHSLSAFVPRPG